MHDTAPTTPEAEHAAETGPFDPTALLPGDPVGVRFSTWDGRPHWRGDVVYLGRDEFGHWLASPRGTHWARQDWQFDSTRHQVVLVPAPQEAVDLPLGCSPSSYTDDAPADASLIYVDVTTAPKWAAGNPVEVCAVDLDLDVIHRVCGEVFVDDEDEFDEHREQMDYPSDLIAQARRDCAWVLTAVRDEVEPFGQVWRGWLENAAGEGR